MGKDKADKNPSKRLRENGSQTDEDDEHVDVGGVMSARLEEMNTKLDQVLTALKNLKQSLQSAEEEIESLQESQKETSAQVEENNEDIDFLFEDTGALRRRNIKLGAYTRCENVRIFNVGEEEDENTEELGRFIILKAGIQDKVYILVNIYARKKDKVSGKFYKNLHRVLQTEDLDCEENIIIGGDFNCPLDPKLDKKG
ncbi:unnamed protein product, partial [Porites lobata]